MVWLPDGKKFEDVFIRFDRIRERDGRTDTQNDRRTPLGRAGIVSRGNKLVHQESVDILGINTYDQQWPTRRRRRRTGVTTTTTRINRDADLQEDSHDDDSFVALSSVFIATVEILVPVNRVDLQSHSQTDFSIAEHRKPCNNGQGS